MPFVIEKNGPDDKPFCVYTQAEDGDPKGDPHGCHPTREKAVAQLRALYANVPDARKQYESMYPPEIPRADLVAYSIQPREGQHCVTRADGSVVKCHNTREAAEAHLGQLVGKHRAGGEMEVKSYDSQTTVADADQGVVHAVVSVFGNVDADGDRVVPGAFRRTIERAQAKGKFPPGVWSHDWKTPVAKTLDMYEDADGLHVIGKFNLETSAGRDTFSNIKHGIIDEYSFGFTDATREAKGDAKDITDLLMFEWSPTLIGANRETRTIAVKAGGGEGATHPRSLAESTEEVMQVIAAAKERLADYVGALHAIQLKEGRILSAARRERLAQIRDSFSEYLLSLGQMQDQIEELLADTEPPSTRDEMQRQWMRLQQNLARANGVTM